MTRFWFIDAVKFFGAQCILLHHLSIYSPIAQEIGLYYPLAVNDFSQLSRLAVQVFLVISGFLLAKVLSKMRAVHLPSLLLKRYARLAPFFLLSLCMCVVAAFVLQDYLWGSWVPEVPSLLGFLAHALLVQSVLDVPAISSGVWYVAIDFQLFALTMFLAWFFSSHEKIRVDNAKLKLTLSLLGLASLWVFNRFETLDNWAIYFAGSYVLGLLASWARDSRANQRLFLLTWGLGLLSVMYEPRIRIEIALIIAMALFLMAHNKGEFLSLRVKAALATLGDSAYAIFLNHFVLILLYTAVWDAFEMEGLKASFAMLLLYWLSALAFGVYLHLRVETQLARLEWTPLVNFLQRFRLRPATELYKAI